MGRPKLLIAESERELSSALTDFFQASPELELCGVAHDGMQALAMVLEKQPDIVVLDLILPLLDGISVLVRIRDAPLPRPPRIIVTAQVNTEEITARALRLGACYYILKPYSLEDLQERILWFAEPAAAACLPAGNFRDKLRRALRELRTPPNIRGFSYMIEAAEILSQEKMPCSITKVVYPEVARRCDTTAECVESAVRKTIRKIYEKDSPALRILTDREEGAGRLSNAKFLLLLVEKVQDGSLGAAEGVRREAAGRSAC